MKNIILLKKDILVNLDKSLVNNIILALVLSCCFVNAAFAQSERFKTEEVENKIEFEGNADSVWTYLSNLGNLQYLVPSTIEKSILIGNGKGSIVKITLKNSGGTVEEEVIKLNNKKRVIGYKMISTPMPIKNYAAHFIVTEINQNTVQVRFKASFKVQEINKKGRINAFNKLQLELLNNIKKLKNEK